MRKTIYHIVSAIPAKLFFVLEAAISLGPTLVPDKFKAWADWVMTPEQIRLIGISGLAISFAYFALLQWLKPKEDGEEGAPSISSTGPQSPNLSGQFHGPVTVSLGASTPLGHEAIIRPPAATEAQVSLTRDRPRMKISQDALDAAAGKHVPKRTPDLKLAGLLTKLYKFYGGAPDDPLKKREFQEKINRAIADAATLNDLIVWARIGDRGLEILSSDTLRHCEFDHLRNEIKAWIGYDGRPFIYWDMHFNLGQVQRIWPK